MTTLTAADVAPGADDLMPVLVGVIAPLVTTVRDIRRYINVLPFALALLGREVAAVDLLALEALRLFLPTVYERLPGLSEILTANDIPDDDSRAAAIELLDELQDAAGVHGSVVRDLVRLVFPGAYQLRAGEPLDRSPAESIQRTVAWRTVSFYGYTLRRHFPEYGPECRRGRVRKGRWAIRRHLPQS